MSMTDLSRPSMRSPGVSSSLVLAVAPMWVLLSGLGTE
jgi:hypothetical protein